MTTNSELIRVLHHFEIFFWTWVTITWRGLPYKEDGVGYWKFYKEPEVPKSCFCGHGLNFFHPWEVPKYSKTTHLLSYSFGSTLEGTTKALAVDVFEAEHSKIYQIACGIPSATLFPGPFPQVAQGDNLLPRGFSLAAPKPGKWTGSPSSIYE